MKRLNKVLILTATTICLLACQTIPTTVNELNSTTEATLKGIQTKTEVTLSNLNKKYHETNFHEKFASENIEQTAQEFLELTQLSNFLTVPSYSEASIIKKSGHLIHASAGIWVNTQRGRDNNTYPGQFIKYDKRIEQTIQRRIGEMGGSDILSWKHPYWGALWVHNVTRSYSESGKKCLHFDIGTPHRIMAIFYGQTACLNQKTGIFEPQEVRYVDLLPVEPIKNFGRFKIPGERIDTWNI